MNITQKPSPNYSQGRQGTPIDRVVIHWVGQGDAHSAASWFSNPNSQVSAHYIVGNDVVYQCVAEENTAWHSGKWEMNLRSIGIEHEATPDRAPTDEIYKRSGQLVRQIADEFNIPLDRTHIIGHSDVKATQCPGTIDIDRIIQEAKMEPDNCEQELEDMRASRNKWKQKFYDIEQTLETEREDNAKTIGEKNAQIDSLNETNAKLNESNSRLNEENTKLTDRNDVLSAQNEALAEENAQLDEQMKQNTDTILSLRKELTKCRGNLKKKLCGFSRWERLWSLFRCKS